MQYFAFIDNKIGRIIAQEVALYSDKLKIAGRVDLVAQWDGEYSIIDFKTSKKVKTNEQEIPYKQQICAYAVCFEEMYGIKINNGIILMSAYNASDMLAPRTNMWQFDPFCYLDDLQDTIDKYKQHRMKRQAEKLTTNPTNPWVLADLALIHICRCRRIERCRSRWSPYH